MADNLIIKIDGDASNLERELNNAAGTGVRAFKRFGDGTNEQLDRMQDMVDDLRDKLIEMGEDGEDAMEDFGDAGEDALSKIGREAKNAGKQSEDSMVDAANKSANAWERVSKVLKGVLGAAVVRKVADFGKEAIGLASDLDEVQNVIDVTFGEGNAKIEDFAQNAAKQFGISELSAKRMTGTMGAMLKSLDVDNVDDMATSLVGLAADMGSFYNLEAEEAFSKLRSGISGQTEPLKQLGINMSADTLEAFALSKGLKKQYKDMTAAEQATLRYEYIMKATADAQGDFARTSGSMANQLKIAKLNIENMKASLGKALLPAATAATHAMNNFMTNVQEGIPAVKSAISNFVQTARAELDKFGITERLTDGLRMVKNVLNEGIDFALNIFQSIADSPVMSAIGDALQNALAGFLGIWDKIGELISALEPVWQYLKENIQGFVDAFLNAKLMLITVINQIFDFIRAALDLIIGLLTLDGERIKEGFRGMKDALIGIVRTLWTGIGDILSNAWTNIMTFLNLLWEKIKAKIAEMDLKQAGLDLLETLKNGITEGWEKIKSWLSETKDKVLKALGEIDLKQAGIDVLSTLLAGFITTWATIIKWISDRVQDMLDAFGKIDLKQAGTNVIQSLKKGFESKWEDVKGWLNGRKKAVEDSFEGIDLKESGKNIVGSLKQGFIDAWNGFVGTLEDLINATISKIPDFAKDWLNVSEVHLRATVEEETSVKETPNSDTRTASSGAGSSSTGRNTGQARTEAAGYLPYGDPRTKKIETAVDKIEDTTEDLADAVERSATVNPFTPLTEVPGAEMPSAETEAAQTAALEPIQTAASETANNAAAAAEAAAANAKTAESSEETNKAALTAAEGTQAAVEGLQEDGFTWDDGQLGETVGTVEEAISDANKERSDYVQNAFDFFMGFFNDKEDAEQKALNGIDADMNKGFNSVTGGNGAGSDYTLLDEYNELMQLWSGNKDANGEWIADWSEGGIGQTLADLIQEKMPGKYWADLTDEDKTRMAGMTASDGYTKGQYEEKFLVTEPVTVPAVLDVQGVETENGETSEALDLTALTEGVPEEALLSWQTLSDILSSITTVLSGGGEEGGAGLDTVLSNISATMGESIPGAVSAMNDALATIPSGVEVALAAVGRATLTDEGEMVVSGGNTFITAFGVVKGLFEDTNTAIGTFVGYLNSGIPNAVATVSGSISKATGLVQGLATAAENAAQAFFNMAAGIMAAVAALQALHAAGGGGGSSSGEGGIEVFAAAHGGQHSGIGVVGENGPEIISTSRNMNVFTNRALEIAQDKVANVMSRSVWPGSTNNQTNISNDNSRTSTVNVGTVLGSDWLGNEIDRRITRIMERELFYAR